MTRGGSGSDECLEVELESSRLGEIIVTVGVSLYLWYLGKQHVWRRIHPCYGDLVEIDHDHIPYGESKAGHDCSECRELCMGSNRATTLVCLKSRRKLWRVDELTNTTRSQQDVSAWVNNPRNPYGPKSRFE